jgi:hypothetical protein
MRSNQPERVNQAFRTPDVKGGGRFTLEEYPERISDRKVHAALPISKVGIS